MPAYFDESTKTWFCKFYYTDYTGTKKQKKKRGFKLQREAKEWERAFLERLQGTPNMTFQSLYDLYIEDMSHRLRQNSIDGKKNVFKNRILPYFKDKPVNAITPTDIRAWQNALIKEGYSDTYLKTVNNQLAAIFNYAVRYYDLKDNPCRKAGSIGKSHAGEKGFWTKGEFKQFLSVVEEKPEAKMAFLLLYWTGMRIGELLALTYKDIDLDKRTIFISKSYQRIDGRDIITPPKTPKSKRNITIPPFLAEELKEYTSRLYGIMEDERMFRFTKSYMEHEIIKGIQKSGVKRIRLHDLRHSHASMLVEMGFTPLAIAERLGHEKIETTLNTYSHLYPNKQGNSRSSWNLKTARRKRNERST